MPKRILSASSFSLIVYSGKNIKSTILRLLNLLSLECGTIFMLVHSKVTQNGEVGIDPQKTRAQ
jgi:hypothetical protein